MFIMALVCEKFSLPCEMLMGCIIYLHNRLPLTKILHSCGAPVVLTIFVTTVIYRVYEPNNYEKLVCAWLVANVNYLTSQNTY